jgi:hypothetical protein
MRNGENQKTLKENYNGISSIKMSNRRQVNELKRIIKDEEKKMKVNVPSIASEVIILIIIALIAAAALSMSIYTYEDTKDAFTSIDVIGEGGTGAGTFTASGKTKLTLVADTGMVMGGVSDGKKVTFESIGSGGGPSGSTGDVQFNNGSGGFGGEPQFNYVSTSSTLGVSNVTIVDTLIASGFTYPSSTPTPVVGQVITLTGANTLSFTSASGVSTINGLNDASSSGTSFPNSIMLGQKPISASNADKNTAVGLSAMYQITSGTSNVVIGYNAGGDIATGNNLTIIGASAGSGITNGNNLIVIGANATNSGNSNEITLGNSSHEILRVGTTTLTSLSDGRDKTNIEETQYGLDFLMRLRPVDYTWRRRILEPGDANNPKNGKRRSGFIAQELLEASGEDGNQVLDLVYQANPERLEARYGNLIPSMVKSIQQLENKVRMLEDKLSRRL